MKILLTGSHGFVGTHVHQMLVARGHEVCGVDIFEPRVHGPNPTIPDGVRRGSYAFLFPEDLEDVEVVIHLAAQVGVADSMTDPLRYVIDNTSETAVMLERLKHHNTLSGQSIRKIIVASSMSVYGDPEVSTPIGEEWPTRPASVYGLTKYDQEALVMLLAPLMGATPIALRFFNIYGPGQALTNPYTGVLANFANNILRGDPPIVYEDGMQTRDFIYVEDVTRAVVGAVEEDLTGVYNVCTGRASTIFHVASQMMTHLYGTKRPRVTYTSRPGDIRHCVGRNLKLRNALPWWEPRPFEEGIHAYASHLLASAQAPEGHAASPST